MFTYKSFFFSFVKFLSESPSAITTVFRSPGDLHVRPETRRNVEKIQTHVLRDTPNNKYKTVLCTHPPILFFRKYSCIYQRYPLYKINNYLICKS